jgi:hypothetical protein
MIVEPYGRALKVSLRVRDAVLNSNLLQ